MLSCCRILNCEALDSSGRCVSEGIDALIIISRDERHDPATDDVVDELLIYRIQILVLIDDQMFKMYERDRIQVPCDYLSKTQAHHFSRQNTRICLGPRTVKGD